MASQKSLAIARAESIQRINKSLEKLSKGKGHKYVPIPTQGNDQAVLSKNQMVHIADVLDQLTSSSKDTNVARPISDEEAANMPDAEVRAQDTIDNLKSKSSAKAKDK